MFVPWAPWLLGLCAHLLCVWAATLPFKALFPLSESLVLQGAHLTGQAQILLQESSLHLWVYLPGGRVAWQRGCGCRGACPALMASFLPFCFSFSFPDFSWIDQRNMTQLPYVSPSEALGVQFPSSDLARGYPRSFDEC